MFNVAIIAIRYSAHVAGESVYPRASLRSPGKACSPGHVRAALGKLAGSLA